MLVEFEKFKQLIQPRAGRAAPFHRMRRDETHIGSVQTLGVDPGRPGHAALGTARLPASFRVPVKPRRVHRQIVEPDEVGGRYAEGDERRGDAEFRAPLIVQPEILGDLGRGSGFHMFEPAPYVDDEQPSRTLLGGTNGTVEGADLDLGNLGRSVLGMLKEVVGTCVDNYEAHTGKQARQSPKMHALRAGYDYLGLLRRVRCIPVRVCI